jgi:hypothetical protein
MHSLLPLYIPHTSPQQQQQQQQQQQEQELRIWGSGKAIRKEIARKTNTVEGGYYRKI